MVDSTSDSSIPATYQDVLDAPPHKVAELIDGVLYTFPRPATPQGLASSVLGTELMASFHKGRGGSGGWWILDEPELHLSEDVLVPDLAGWRRTRVPEFPDIPYWTIRSDWLCEVLSPRTRATDLGPKRDIYAREGVPHIWLIHPDHGRVLQQLAASQRIRQRRIQHLFRHTCECRHGRPAEAQRQHA